MDAKQHRTAATNQNCRDSNNRKLCFHEEVLSWQRELSSLESQIFLAAKRWRQFERRRIIEP